MNTKILFSNAILLVLVKAFSMLSSLMVIPLYFVFFSSEIDYVGIWLSFLAGLLIILSLDFGIGSRLKNDLLKMGGGKKFDVVNSITLAFISYFAIGFFLFFLLLLLIFTVDFSRLTFLDGIDYKEVKLMLLLFAFFLLLNIPLKINIPILQSQQKNALAGLILVLPQITIFLYVLLVGDPLTSSSMLELTIVLLIFQTLFNLGISFKFLDLDFQLFLSTYRSFSSLISCLKRSFSTGLTFFVVQICIIVLFNSNELFYSAIGRPDLVVIYQYYYRPFSIFFVGFSIVSLPFWSAIRALVISGKKEQAKQYGYILLGLNAAVLICLVPFSYYFEFFLDAWLGPGFFNPSFEFLFLFSIFSFLMCFLMMLTAILNSFDAIYIQSKILFFCVFFKVLAVVLLNDHNFDVVLYSTVLTLILSVFFLSYIAAVEWEKNLSIN